MKINKIVNLENSQDTIPQIARRAFVLNGVLATGAIGFGIRKVFAQARVAGKPAFTEATVNRLLTSRSEPQYREMCAAAQKDLKGFVRKTFYLTPEQEKSLSNLTPEQVRTFQSGIKQSLEKNARVAVSVKMPPNNNPQRQRPNATDGSAIKNVSTECGVKPDGTIYCKIIWSKGSEAT